ncbi:flagellar hook-length control protein FliK [Porticoccus sp. GXU_MW_L64]
MNTPQITAVPAVGKAVNGGAPPVSESLSPEDGESFARHLQQLDQSRPQTPQQLPKQAQPEAGPEAPVAQGLRDVAQLRAEPLPELAQPLTVELAEVGEAGAVDADQQAVLQQLAERLQAGEEVAVSSTQPQIAADALPVAEVGTGQQAVLANTRLPLAGSNLPQGGEPLPPVASDVARQAVTKPLPQAAEPGLARATSVSQQELPVKAGQELAINGPQAEKALADVGRFSAILGAAAEHSGQPAAGNSAPLTVSLASSATPLTGSGETGAQRPVISLNTPLGEPGWTQEIGSRLQVLVERGNQRAEIRLNPPELGSVEVKVINDGERTSVTFFAQNATTREALEAALPRLRDMFGDSGLQLADANVSQQQTMAGEHGHNNEGNSDGFSGVDTMADPESGGQVAVRAINGLVDTYI